ncbi:MAG: hypothetical protein HKO91_02035 [Desulfobacterales bacterium]|nr:hypothetical protein [Desulfobacterales bacterium]
MTPEMQVWLNDEFIPRSAATVPLLSHSFSRASAIFEIFRIHSSPQGPATFRMTDHLNRLLNSARLLQMELRYSLADIAKAVSETAKKNEIKNGLVKIMVYWSEEMVIGLLPNTNTDIAIFTVPEEDDMHLDSSEPVATCLSKWRKIDPRTVPVEAKACSNYLNAYLARKEAAQRGFDVGIMLDTDDFLAEGSTESLIIIRGEEIQVPPLGRVLASISRLSVLEMAEKMGLQTVQQPLNLEDLQQADEMFLSHTGNKVESVCQFEQKHMQAPGPITKKLRHQMYRILTFQDEAYIDWMEPLSNF